MWADFTFFFKTFITNACECNYTFSVAIWTGLVFESLFRSGILFSANSGVLNCISPAVIHICFNTPALPICSRLFQRYFIRNCFTVDFSSVLSVSNELGEPVFLQTRMSYTNVEAQPYTSNCSEQINYWPGQYVIRCINIVSKKIKQVVFAQASAHDVQKKLGNILQKTYSKVGQQLLWRKKKKSPFTFEFLSVRKVFSSEKKKRQKKKLAEIKIQ